MKQNRYTLLLAIAFVFTNFACKKEIQPSPATNPDQSETAIVNQDNGLLTGRPSSPSGQCNPNAFNIVLESKTLVTGNWEWVWSVQNSNPGNGNNGTVQDLSNWGMQFGACFNWAAVVSASYSSNNLNWTGFTPAFQVDPSQSCMTTSVLKFDFGTTGSAKSYYKLVVNQNYVETSVPGYYKSGTTTGCCTFNFTGIGCGSNGEEEE